MTDHQARTDATGLDLLEERARTDAGLLPSECRALLAEVRSLRERDRERKATIDAALTARIEQLEAHLAESERLRDDLTARLNAASKDDLAARVEEITAIHEAQLGWHAPLLRAAADRIRMDARAWATVRRVIPDLPSIDALAAISGTPLPPDLLAHAREVAAALAQYKESTAGKPVARSSKGDE